MCRPLAEPVHGVAVLPPSPFEECVVTVPYWNITDRAAYSDRELLAHYTAECAMETYPGEGYRTLLWDEIMRRMKAGNEGGEPVNASDQKWDVCAMKGCYGPPDGIEQAAQGVIGTSSANLVVEVSFPVCRYHGNALARGNQWGFLALLPHASTRERGQEK